MEVDLRYIPKSKKVKFPDSSELERELNELIAESNTSFKPNQGTNHIHIIELVDALAELVGQSSYYKDLLKQYLQDKDLI